LRIEPVPVVVPVERPTAVIVLSEHAARRFIELGLPERAPGADYFAVGQRTAECLAAGGLAASVPKLATSEGLLAMPEVAALGPDDRIWIVAGVGGRSVIESTLASRCLVQKLALYRRIAVDAIDASLASVDTIIASSAESLAPIRSLWQGDSSILIVTSSARVALAARRLGFQNVEDAGGADPAAVVRCLANR
jgi:uroporphyrinogen-III synthase